MIGQYLSNTNENITVPVLQNFLELNKALVVATQSIAKPIAITQLIAGASYSPFHSTH
jgi:hypothetical protein